MEKQEIRTFGRRHGKKLSARQMGLIENLLPSLIPAPTDGDILEIGFGAGEHVRELAKIHPDKIIVGAEPFMNGVASLLSAITDNENNILPEYQNIRIFADDVRILLRKTKAKFSEIWVLHPDPWPKAKHEKRRLLSAEFLTMLGQHLDKDCHIIIGTDHWEYFDWIVEQAKKTSLSLQIMDIETIQTRYQHKNKAGTSEPKYLTLSNL